MENQAFLASLCMVGEMTETTVPDHVEILTPGTLQVNIHVRAARLTQLCGNFGTLELTLTPI